NSKPRSRKPPPKRGARSTPGWSARLRPRCSNRTANSTPSRAANPASSASPAGCASHYTTSPTCGDVSPTRDKGTAMPNFKTPEPISVTFELGVGTVRITASDRTDTTVDVRPSNESDESDVQAAQRVRV